MSILKLAAPIYVPIRYPFAAQVETCSRCGRANHNQGIFSLDESIEPCIGVEALNVRRIARAPRYIDDEKLLFEHDPPAAGVRRRG